MSAPLANRHVNRFASLVVPHDLTAIADRALPVARQLAQRGDLGVHLVTTASPGLDPDVERADLAQHARAFHGRPVALDVIASNDPAPALAAFVGEFGHPLLCLATHGHTAIGELVLGSVADSLLHHRPGPALIVGPRVAADFRLENGLLVCIDPFALETDLLDVVGEWCTTIGGSVELLEVVEPSETADEQQLTIDLRDAATRFPGATVSTVASHDPARAIVDTAASSGKVVAMASHLRAGLRRAVLGSVTWEVIRFSPTPVLVVPAPPTSESPRAPKAARTFASTA